MLKKIDLIKKIFGIAILVGLIILVLPHLRTVSVEDIVENTPTSIPLAALSFLIFFSLKAIVILIPMAVLYTSVGIVFPPIWAFVIAYLGVSLTLSIGYFNGKRLGEEKVELLLKKYPKLDRYMKKRRGNLTYFCFFSRLIPFPFDIFSMFAGATKIPFLKYLLMSLLGLTPKLILFVFTGITIANTF